MIIEVLSGTNRVGPLHYFYADEIIGRADVTQKSYPIKGGNAALVDRGSSLSRLLSRVPDAGNATFAEVVATDAHGRHLLTRQELGPAASPADCGPRSTRPTRIPSTPCGSATSAPSATRTTRTARPVPTSGRFSPTRAGRCWSGSTSPVRRWTCRRRNPGRRVNRSYELGTDPTGAGFAFDWTLPGGDGSAQATPTYTFPQGAQAGDYPVTVAVDSPDGSFGWGQTLLRSGTTSHPVTEPSPSPSPGTGGDGPDDSGPNDNQSGSATGEPNPEPTEGSDEPTAGPTGETVPEATLPPFETTGGTVEPSHPEVSEPTEPTEPIATPTTDTGDEVTGILLTAAQAGADGGESVSDPPRPPRGGPAAGRVGVPGQHRRLVHDRRTPAPARRRRLGECSGPGPSPSVVRMAP